jgi:CysZ protein
MLSLEYIDYPLSNNGREFPAAKNYAAQERGLTLGLGFSLTILTLLPIVNILAMPIGVAAGTLFYDQKIRKELITPHATNDR